MGYQLPGIANVAFAGFTALSKQATGAAARANNKKKGKDRGHSAAPAARPAKGGSRSSQTTAKEAGLPWISSCESAFSRSFILKCRQDLRPLLNALRFVESSNRENCPDGDSGASIGPLQISRQYHQDAWKQTSAMASSIAWSRCRDLNHAENTVIAYWMKYCPEALETRDFETLAKIHNGGPQGPKKEKTGYYWSKVSEQLSKQEVISKGRSKENMTNDSSGDSKHARQESKIHERSPSAQRSPSALLSITNRLPTSRIQKTGSIDGAKNLSTSKQRTPLMQNATPTLFQQSSVNFSDRKAQEAKKERERHSCEKPKSDSSQSVLKRDVKIGHSKIRQDNGFTESRLTNKRHRQTDSIQSNNILEYGRAFHLGYWKVPRGLKHEKAAVIIQAFWKMYSMRSQYKRLKVAAVLIQRQWRSKNASLPLSQHKPSSKSHNPASTALIVIKEETERDWEHIRPAGLPCELLYKGDISPKQEDALLTELANLLKWEDDSTDNLQSCHSFRFPRSEEDNQACTPKLSSSMKMSPEDSERSFAWAKRSCESNATTSLSHDSIFGKTSLFVEESMEKEILDEFAKLFPCVHDDTLDVDSTSGYSCAIDEIVNEEDMDKVFSPTDHGIIRRLQFDSTENVEDLGCRDFVPETEKLAESVDNLQSDLIMRRMGSLPSGNLCAEIVGCDTETDADEDDELKDIKIPLLADSSPIMKPRSVRMKNQINPCNRKVERALVSSLSEWQFSAFEIPVDESMSEVGAKDPSSARYRLALQCKEDGGMDMPSGFICQSSLQQSIKIDDVSVESPAEVPRSDCLLETSDRRNSTVYCRALFQCMSLSFDKFKEVDDDGLRESMDNPINECGCTTVANTISDSTCLSDLCDLWNEHNVDLLTRSLKYKNFQASGGMPNIKWEMQSLERFPKQLKEESRELVKRQRDVIYTNIAAYCGMDERHQLYHTWGIQKLLTGRLRKIIYELLWIDPQRYAESADLVIQYL